MATPGIILSGKFVRPRGSVFAEYLEYIDRKEAVRNEMYNQYSAFVYTNDSVNAYQDGKHEMENLDTYIDYLANPSKTSRLFTKDADELGGLGKDELKEQFQQAYDNGSVMWQDVFSFDNNWLIEKKLYNPKTKELNERAIQNATRVAMHQMLEKEGMAHSAVWTASIHYNTDNIHVHVATVEPIPTREKKEFIDTETGEIVNEHKGYRPRKTLRVMKSKFLNELVQLSQIHIKVDELQKQIVASKRNEKAQTDTTIFDKSLAQLRKQLPHERGYWKYGYAKRFKFDRTLNPMIEHYLRANFAKEFSEMKELLSKATDEYTRAYGESKTNYASGKLETLYRLLGNSILSDLKGIEDEQRMNVPIGKIRTQLPKEEIKDNSQFQSALTLLRKNAKPKQRPALLEANEEPFEWETIDELMEKQREKNEQRNVAQEKMQTDKQAVFTSIGREVPEEKVIRSKNIYNYGGGLVASMPLEKITDGSLLYADVLETLWAESDQKTAELAENVLERLANDAFFLKDTQRIIKDVEKSESMETLANIGQVKNRNRTINQLNQSMVSVFGKSFRRQSTGARNSQPLYTYQERQQIKRALAKNTQDYLNERGFRELQYEMTRLG